MGDITNTRPFGNLLVLKKILAHQDRLLKKIIKNFRTCIFQICYFPSPLQLWSLESLRSIF